jgi:hypothetical protein
MVEKIHKCSPVSYIINLILGCLLAFLVSWLLTWLLSLILRLFLEDYQGITSIVRIILTSIVVLIFFVAVFKDFIEQSRAYKLAISRKGEKNG